MTFYKLICPEERNGVEVQIEALALQYFLLPQDADPEFAKLLIDCPDLGGVKPSPSGDGFS